MSDVADLCAPSIGLLRSGGVSRQSGFALLEALVALILVSFTLSMLPAAFGLARRAMEQTDVLSLRDREQAGLGFIQRHLASALPITRAAPHGGPGHVVFDGRAEKLAFAAALNVGTLGSGVFSVEIGLQRDADGTGALRLVVAPLGPAPETEISSVSEGGEGAHEARTIVRDVRRFDLRYFGQLPGEPEPRWHTQWQDPETLPRLVEMSVRAGDAPHERRWHITVDPKLRLR